MTLYIGVDLHPHQQTIGWCDNETVEPSALQSFRCALTRRVRGWRFEK